MFFKMTHVKFNSSYLPYPHGFINTGVTCYFNSLMQCLLSCTSMTQYITTKENTDPLYRAYRELIQLSICGRPAAINGASVVFTTLYNTLRTSRRYRTFGFGQEDVGEGFHLFIDMLHSKYVERLFEHRFKTRIECTCGHITVLCDEGLVCNINVRAITDITTYMTNTQSTLEGYRCTKCASTAPKLQTRKITMVPEILVFLLEKFDHKVHVDIPQTIAVPSMTRNPHVFKFVAQAEHSGSRTSGHYWSRALRRTSNGIHSYKLNDTHVTASALQPTLESYMLFYHIT